MPPKVAHVHVAASGTVAETVDLSHSGTHPLLPSANAPTYLAEMETDGCSET